MRLLKRRRDETAGETPDATPDEPADEPAGDDEALRAAIEELSAANRAKPDRATERRLLSLRHALGARLVDAAAGEVSFAAPAATLDESPDGPPGSGALPEFGPADLTPGLLRAGILRDGCVLVRGLVPRERAQALAGAIDSAFAESDRVEAGGRASDGYYEEFAPQSRFGPVVRPWIKQGGGVLAADSPRAGFQLMELFAGAGLRELVGGYLGEPALISVHKTTLRKAPPDVTGAWHQDGYFMGPVRALNLWLALSHCGEDAPGLDIVPARLESYAATATDGSPLDYTVSRQKVDEAAGGVPVISPVFEPGDALFFDELFLHQTGTRDGMTKPRFAVESWFFGPSGFPGEYAPLAV